MLDRPTLLDGAMGTALIARGLPAEALPEEWLLLNPTGIRAVHAEHARAGARVLLTCTFSGAAPRLEARVAASRLTELCSRAARMARWAADEATAPDALVAGALGPTGLHAPGAATREHLVARYQRPFAALAAARVDLLWVESQWDLREALAALEAARSTGLPAVVTFGVPEQDGAFRPPGGARLESWLLEVERAGAFAAGVNCVAAGPALAALARWAASSLRIPFVAKPSPGLPGAVLPPREFAAALGPAIEAGLRVAGGCCGATGDHLRAIAAILPPSP